MTSSSIANLSIVVITGVVIAIIVVSFTKVRPLEVVRLTTAVRLTTGAVRLTGQIDHCGQIDHTTHLLHLTANASTKCLVQEENQYFRYTIKKQNAGEEAIPR